MNKYTNIAIVGLGQIGLYLYNELRLKKNYIEKKTGKKIKIVAISAKNKNKKRKFKINKKIFYKNPFKILDNKKINILFECIGQSDGISKKIVERALNNKIHVRIIVVGQPGSALAKTCWNLDSQSIVPADQLPMLDVVPKCCIHPQLLCDPNEN